MKTRRRDFIRLAGTGAAAASFSTFHRRSFDVQPAAKGDRGELTLGLASYTFREFGLDETLAISKKLGLTRISLKSVHLPLESTDEEIRSAARKIKEEGLDLYACGVIYMTNEAEVRQAFHYAAIAGIPLIIGVPNYELLGLCRDLVRESRIRLAVHNHGPEDKLYPTPRSVLRKIIEFGAGLGLCLDTDHTARSGVDPAEAAREAGDRLFDVHIKDVTSASAAGEPVEIGRGVVDIPGFVRTLVDLNYAGTAAFEYEKDGENPLSGLAESVGYIRGVLAALRGDSPR
jgi:inosose dehydratase